MKIFEFTLQRLLEAKEALERAAEEKLAAAIRLLETARERLRQLKGRMRQQIKEIEAFRGARTHRHKISVHQRFLERIQHQVVAQTQLVAKQEASVEELRKQLCVIMRERKTLEKLREREWLTWVDEQKRAEQKEMDEFASVGFVHQAMAAAADRQERTR